ncbi:hypothetical protein FGM00_07250 [Aggregatimonas sangjinii]|uniref:gluconokinase n=1 Tax=Aggregatimonas sangjinii TaxID=2583587 RepID=A0A5B7SMX0_9FLAO|nr:shikimate kinase [Aggregatimonas sangjinii]QCW99905.1 hypothetical protein FGM00_07250 [Aggregatimonas sangjinii]
MENKNFIVILVGVCGTEKSAIGKRVAEKLGVPFFDADKLFSSEERPNAMLLQNGKLEKWLQAIEEFVRVQSIQRGCVVSCSILKKAHRKRLTANIDCELDWVFMNDSYENVANRFEKLGNDAVARTALQSDFEILEAPKKALTIDMSYSDEEILTIILKYMARKYG